MTAGCQFEIIIQFRKRSASAFCSQLRPFIQTNCKRAIGRRHTHINQAQRFNENDNITNISFERVIKLRLSRTLFSTFVFTLLKCPVCVFPPSESMVVYFWTVCRLQIFVAISHYLHHIPRDPKRQLLLANR